MDLISNYLDADGNTSKPRKKRQTKRKRVETDRTRLTLFAKKEIVQKFYNYLDETEDASNGAHMKKTFVALFNKENEYQIDVSSIGKWIRAEKHGEFLPWGGANSLDNKVCFVEKVIEKIDDHLSDRDAHHGEYNQVARSPSIPEEYGVIARKFTPAGTFLGYYKGECIDSKTAESSYDFDYIFCIGEGKFIDASKLLSCYARYYNCAVNRSDQNVCVERLLWTNPQKAICFITTRDVQKGEEFLISYGCEYWERQSSKAIMSDSFRRVCNRLMKKVSYKYQPQEELYSFQAPDLAREFRDDRSDSDDGDDSSDSDYVDSSRRTYNSRVANQSTV
jgi:hypothetical protein